MKKTIYTSEKVWYNSIMKIENSSTQALRRSILESHEVFTVELVYGRPVCKNAKRLEALRESIKYYNKHIADGVKLRVKLHGRGHRHGYRPWHQALPLCEATSAKVYINNVY